MLMATFKARTAIGPAANHRERARYAMAFAKTLAPIAGAVGCG